MRVNVYAEEMTSRVEIIEKEINGNKFTGCRFYMELPVTTYPAPSYDNPLGMVKQLQGPFIHQRGDDDSAAVTFWGKQDLRCVLRLALDKLNKHYAQQLKVTDAGPTHEQGCNAQATGEQKKTFTVAGAETSDLISRLRELRDERNNALRQRNEARAELEKLRAHTRGFVAGLHADGVAVNEQTR